MAVRFASSDNSEGDNDGTTHEYIRQMTLNDPSCPVMAMPRESRALVRRPSVDLAKLTKQKSRAIIDNYFRRSAHVPVLEHMSNEALKKISDLELGKVDIIEAKRQLTEDKVQLHDEVKRKVVRFPSYPGRKQRVLKRAFEPAVDNIIEREPTLDHSLNSNNNVADEAIHVAAATATTHKEIHVIHSNTRLPSIPILDSPTNPFDVAFSAVEIDTPGLGSVTTLHHHTQSHSNEAITIGNESLAEDDKDDITSPSSQSITFIASTEVMTTSTDEVDCFMPDVVSTSTEQTSTVDLNNDVLIGAHGMITSSSEVSSRNTMAGLEYSSFSLSSGFIQSDLVTEEPVTTAAASSNSVRPSNSSINGLHLELSYGASRECSDASDEDDEQPKSKPMVAETPLDVDGPLPSKFHGIPDFSEVQQFFGRIPTFTEYMTYRLDKISVDLECRYPELDKHFQQVIGTLGNTLTYEVFHRAALNIHSQAKQMCEGVFMVLRFGRQLFENFPDNASSFTTQWVNEYIIHQGGWDAVTDRYFKEQYPVLSPVTTAEITGASGVSGDGEVQMESTDGGAMTHIVTSATSYPHAKKPVNMSPPVWDITQRPVFTHLERACSVEFLPSIAEVTSKTTMNTPPDAGSPSIEPPKNTIAMPQPATIGLSRSLNSVKSLDQLDSSSDHPSSTTNVTESTTSPGNKQLACPIRRVNSAPQLSLLMTSSTSSSSSDMDGPPPGLQERRRSSMQDYNDVFLSYVPYITGAIAPTAAVIHLALTFAQRLSSS